MDRADRGLIAGLAPGFNAVDIDVVTPDLAAQIAGENDDGVAGAVSPDVEDSQAFVGFDVMDPALLVGAGDLAAGDVRFELCAIDCGADEIQRLAAAPARGDCNAAVVAPRFAPYLVVIAQRGIHRCFVFIPQLQRYVEAWEVGLQDEGHVAEPADPAANGTTIGGAHMRDAGEADHVLEQRRLARIENGDSGA